MKYGIIVAYPTNHTAVFNIVAQQPVELIPGRAQHFLIMQYLSGISKRMRPAGPMASKPMVDLID